MGWERAVGRDGELRELAAGRADALRRVDVRHTRRRRRDDAGHDRAADARQHRGACPEPLRQPILGPVPRPGAVRGLCAHTHTAPAS